MKKTLIRILAVLVTLILGFILFVSFTWDKKYNAPYPEITASQDSSVIARGKYLAFGPAHCASCHTPMDKKNEIDQGKEMPMIGGWELNIPPGTFRARNLTPDMETGIGKLTDGEIARLLRHSVGHDGRFIMPFMPFQQMSDDDITALVSYLRSQEPVKNEIPNTEYSFLGKALLALGILSPAGPVTTPPKSVVRDTTAEYGRYIAVDVANCYGCHTERDLKTGAFIGPAFAGGLRLPPDDFSEGFSFITPNLTPDPETGIMAAWNEAAFIARMRAGRVHSGSQMPWGSFSRMDELELKAVYRFIQTLTPVSRKIEKTAYAPGEELPE